MIKRLLIANRGEIAVRIAEAAAELGIATVGVYSEDDATSLHVKRVDEAVALKGRGAAAYLDIAGVVAAAKTAKCDAVHPGYGFLSENAAFARACAAAKVAFVGPTPEQLDLFGDKARARAHAQKCKVPVLPGTEEIDVAGAMAFFAKHAKAGIALKAIAGAPRSPFSLFHRGSDAARGDVTRSPLRSPRRRTAVRISSCGVRLLRWKDRRRGSSRRPRTCGSRASSTSARM